MINAAWKGDWIYAIVRSTSVSRPTPNAALVPVVRTPRDRHPAIAAEIERLAEAARDGHSADDLHGATISVSNTGSYGSEFGTPILNPGNAVTVASA